MARKETGPNAPVQRVTPQVSIDLMDPAKHTSHDSSPPQTPLSQMSRGARSKSAARVPRSRPALPKTFSGEIARDDAREHRRKRNDSHDLSWSPKHTRDSVVDNMLLSLDQMFVSGSPPHQGSRPTYSTYSGEEPFTSESNLVSLSNTRPCGHNISSSISSEHEFPAEDSTFRSSNRNTRTHRSNSSSNFQSELDRIDSIRGTVGEGTQPTVIRPNITPRAAAPSEKDIGTHASRRKGSKSSGSSSVDFGQIMGGPRWQRAIQRRSSSFDHGYDNRAVFTSQGNPIIRPPPITTVSHKLPYDDEEAAPTPTVPAGPRRDRSPQPVATVPLPSPHAIPHTIPFRRRNSNGSSAKLFGRNEKAAPPITIAKDTKTYRFHSRKPSYEVPPLRLNAKTPERTIAEPAPKHYVASGHNILGSGKERQGFLKWVFGPSRNPISLTDDMQSAAPLSIPSQSSIRADSRSETLPNPPPPEKMPWIAPSNMPPSHVPRENLPAVPLNKKTSFFRRRKKNSISGDIPLPARVTHLHTKLQEPLQPNGTEKSPVSSLRKVMNPYLNNPVTSPNNRKEHIEGSTGHKESAIRRVLPRYNAVAESFAVAEERNGPNKEKESFDTAAIWDDSNATLAPIDPHESSLIHIDKENDQQQRAAVVEADKMGSEQRSIKIPTVWNNIPDAMSQKENQRRSNQTVHSRSNSDKNLPEIPKDKELLKSRDGNVPKSKFIASTPQRTTSKDWNATSVEITTKRSGTLSSQPGSAKSNRIWLQPTASKEDLSKSPKLLLLGTSRSNSARASGSSISDYKSASSELPTPTIDVNIQVQDLSLGVDFAADLSELDSTTPSEEDQKLAKRIFDGDEDIVVKSGVAAWLGDEGDERAKIRSAYMELFNWQNLNILAALRGLCGRLLLKGETQQVDRMLDAFSTRWGKCNPNHGFKATDVVHTICYSVLLLNTDLHTVEIEQKMTRTQFIKNTMPTIRRVAVDAAPNAFDRASTLLPARGQYNSLESQPLKIKAALLPLDDSRPPLNGPRSSDGCIGRQTESSRNEISLTPLDYDTPMDDCGPLVKSPFYGKLSMWEVQVEVVLKDFYQSIRHQRLPLSSDDETDRANVPTQSSNSLSVMTGSMLRRTPSTLSKAGSEKQSIRGRLLESRMGTGRWSSKTRPRPRMYPSSIKQPSRTSFDDESSAISPSASSTWSKHSMGKTQTSMSVNSFASSFPQADYKKSIGFANALSQAIIREEALGSVSEETMRVGPLLEDESLELAGAPWAKEGILKHKHHLESVDKKAKDRNWNECFAVVDRGWMRLFQFNMNAKSMRMKAKNQKLPGGVVGGGNWAESAEALGKFLLRQTIASALPPPGYSQTRPHVWALSLPTGAVHLFQVGTPEIVKEFVTTANYWSARLSKEPLIGGISNIEYGWSETVINAALLPLETKSTSGTNNTGPRPSLQSSIRSSMDHGSMRPKLPGDRVTISEWTPPQQSMMASALMEVDQLRALTIYVKSIEEDLQKHNELRGAMILAFSPRHLNHNKAMANWERKSSYLLREIVKFTTYIDCLQGAQVQKEKVHAERAVCVKVEESAIT